MQPYSPSFVYTLRLPRISLESVRRINNEFSPHFCAVFFGLIYIYRCRRVGEAKEGDFSRAVKMFANGLDCGRVYR